MDSCFQRCGRLAVSLAFAAGAALLGGSLFLVACTVGERSADEKGPSDPGDTHRTVRGDPLIIEDPSLFDKPQCQPNRAKHKDYLALTEQLADQGLPLSDEELSVSLRRVETGQVKYVEGPLSHPELRTALRAALGTPLLLESPELRPLRWALLPQVGDQAQGRRYDHVLLHDPLLGCLSVLVLVPPGTGPFPAVHALHGHSESPDYFATYLFGELFQDKGYVLMVPETRAFNGAREEDQATRAMLRNGSTMMGVRVAEHRMALRYLRSREDVLPGSVGLMGHSGGSTAGNLTIRLGMGYAAYISDYTGHYHNIVEAGLLIDETAPALFALGLLVNDFSTAEVPILRVPYGYEDGPVAVFEFFDEWLKGLVIEVED